MQVLRKGSKGQEVEDWQFFLRGLDLYNSVIDGDFGPATHSATIAFQRQNRLTDDGVVGSMTYAKAFEMGFGILDDDDTGINSPNWPPKPNFSSLSFVDKKRIFGDFKYKPSPSPNNPEGITILGDWVSKNIVKVKIPQLKGVLGAPSSGEIFWHQKGEEQIIKLFEAWEKENLLQLVQSWAGSWVPRFVRGSRTFLSNHAYATAFDINVPWNGLKRTPALVGKKGSVRELVPIANDLGFYWGGHFSRKDGMHFEIGKMSTTSKR